ncbi:NUDIX domain-containing protein [Streptomyces cinnamoneus]|uniref:NUDIX hydrolase n=1 Tax=Streptomyces cinnamoneus TaxID=53446 RepID=UPI0033D2F582
MRYTSCVDLHLLLRDGDKVLLGERKNTGFMDGAFHFPSGHLEEGEAATAGTVREAAEEIGVTVDPGDLTLVHVMHHRTNEGRTAFFFETTRWSGEVENREPDKCAGWSWFALDALPEKMIPYAADALRHITKGTLYSERGWEKPS